MNRMRTTWLGRLLAVLALLAPLHLAVATGRARAQAVGVTADAFSDPSDAPEGSGPGTAWLKCREQATADYFTCLGTNPTLSRKAACYMAWDLDNIGCDVELLRAFRIR